MQCRQIGAIRYQEFHLRKRETDKGMTIRKSLTISKMPLKNNMQNVFRKHKLKHGKCHWSDQTKMLRSFIFDKKYKVC